MSDDDKRIIIIRNERLRERAIEVINALVIGDKPWQMTVEPHKARRSLAQNRLYWGIFVRGIQGYANEHRQEGAAPYSEDDIHNYLRERFLPTRVVELNGDVRTARKSTTALNTKEMTDYLETIDRYCVSELGLVLPKPDDIYREAMGR